MTISGSGGCGAVNIKGGGKEGEDDDYEKVQQGGEGKRKKWGREREGRGMTVSEKLKFIRKNVRRRY